MRKLPRVLRWILWTFLWLCAARGAVALVGDGLKAIPYARVHDVTPGNGWTAFARSVDYRFFADTDTSLFLARNVGDESTWIRLAPSDSHVLGPMHWTAPDHLRIPAAFRDGCRTRIDDVVIEWDPR